MTVINKLMKDIEKAKNPLSREIALWKWRRTHNKICDSISRALGDKRTALWLIAYDILVDNGVWLTELLMDTYADDDGLHIAGNTLPNDPDALRAFLEEEVPLISE